MAWTILTKNITPGQLQPLTFIDENDNEYYIYAVWQGQGAIKHIDLVNKKSNKGYKLTFENLLERVVNKKLIQL